MNDKLFYDRIDYIYKNYVKKGIPIPITKSSDVFEEDNVKIGLWFYTNKSKIESLALKGNDEALALLNGTAQMIKLKERVDYIFDNYTINNRFVGASDSFPDGVKIEHWFKRMENVLRKMAFVGDLEVSEVMETFNIKKTSKRMKKGITLKDLNYVFELILFVLYEERIPSSNDLFGDGASMGKYLMQKRDFIFNNKSNDYIQLLNVLIRQKDSDYFNDVKVEMEVKEYKKRRRK